MVATEYFFSPLPLKSASACRCALESALRVAHAHNSSVIIYSNHLTYQALRNVGLDDQALSIVRFEVEELFRGTVLEQWYQRYDQ